MVYPQNSSPSFKCPSCDELANQNDAFCSRCGTSLKFESLGSVVPSQGEDNDPLIGQVIDGRYRVISPIGKGGMGIVYKVQHVHMDKVLALKALQENLLNNSDAIKRFQREVVVASKLDHPNLVRIFDAGRWGKIAFLVMEYVEGESLNTLIEDEKGVFTKERIIHLITQVCDAVTLAHQMEIIHRDLKPDNIMVTLDEKGQEQAKVLDFGLAKFREHQGVGSSGMTQTGSVLGTPLFMSPEQIRGDKADRRSDVYSLGATLYVMLTGSPPFTADTPFGVLSQHLNDPVVPPSHRSNQMEHVAFDAIVLKSLAKKPQDRFQSVQELRLALQRLGKHDESSPILHSDTIEENINFNSKTRKWDFEEERMYEFKHELQNKPKKKFLTFVVGLLIAAGITTFLVGKGDFGLSTASSESEPNNTSVQANFVEEGQVITGYLGRRVSYRDGDVDVFRLKGTSFPKQVSIKTSAIPNMDTQIEVFVSNTAQPIAVIDSVPEGRAEWVHNFPVQDEMEFRFSEKTKRGQNPTENISDPYTFSWESRKESNTHEQEPNGVIESAQWLGIDEKKEGWIGWEGDVDMYCLKTINPLWAFAKVQGIEGVDLQLRVSSAAYERSRTVNSSAVSEDEKTPPFRITETMPLCFEVSATQSGTKTHSMDPYIFSFQKALHGS